MVRVSLSLPSSVLWSTSLLIPQALPTTACLGLFIPTDQKPSSKLNYHPSNPAISPHSFPLLTTVEAVCPRPVFLVKGPWALVSLFWASNWTHQLQLSKSHMFLAAAFHIQGVSQTFQRQWVQTMQVVPQDQQTSLFYKMRNNLLSHSNKLFSLTKKSPLDVFNFSYSLCQMPWSP